MVSVSHMEIHVAGAYENRTLGSCTMSCMIVQTVL